MAADQDGTCYDCLPMTTHFRRSTVSFKWLRFLQASTLSNIHFMQQTSISTLRALFVSLQHLHFFPWQNTNSAHQVKSSQNHCHHDKIIVRHVALITLHQRTFLLLIQASPCYISTVCISHDKFIPTLQVRITFILVVLATACAKITDRPWLQGNNVPWGWRRNRGPIEWKQEAPLHYKHND